MRRIGFFRKDWKNYRIGMPKLAADEFTTLRFPRKYPLRVGEVLKVIYKPYTKEYERLGIAEVVRIESRSLTLSSWKVTGAPIITIEECQADGFLTQAELLSEMARLYDQDRVAKESMQLLTLRWIKREVEIG